MTLHLWNRTLVLFVTLVALGCAPPTPGVIHYDSDACDHCRMTISDPAFAAQVVTGTGKVYRFDDPKCLVSFVAAGQVSPSAIHSIWINDHAHPETLVDATHAVFVVSERLRAPMNGGMAAFASRVDASTLQAVVGGDLRTWDAVSRRVSP
jgi:copper chaperone NosL